MDTVSKICGLLSNVVVYLAFIMSFTFEVGIMRITREQIVAEFWYSDIRTANASSSLAKTLKLNDGKNRWSL